MRSISPVTESPCWPGRPTPTLVPWRHQDPIVLTYHNSVRLLGTQPCRSPMTVDIPEPEERITVRYPGSHSSTDREANMGARIRLRKPEGECTNGPAISGSQPVPKDGSAGSGSIGSVPIRQTPVASARAVRESERRASPWTSMQIHIRNRRSCHSNTLFHRPGKIAYRRK